MDLWAFGLSTRELGSVNEHEKGAGPRIRGSMFHIEDTTIDLHLVLDDILMPPWRLFLVVMP